MSDALEIVLDFGMLPVPATSERRDMREGVSDWVVDRFADIVESGMTTIMETLACDSLVTNPGE